MFDNIGGKIKALAKVVCWLGIIASVIYAIVIWGQNSRYQSTILLGLAVLVGGSLFSWIGSFFTYGFGELIERTASIDNKLNSRKPDTVIPVATETRKDSDGVVKTTTTYKSAASASEEEKILSQGGWKCSKCGKLNYHYSVTCACGARKWEANKNQNA